MKETYVRWLIVILAALGITACDSGSSDPDAGSETNPCEPSQNCCTEDGTWRTDCDYGCDFDSGNCWPQCNPGGNCCQPDGTNCPYGCDDITCYRDCNPSDLCCESDGTWTVNRVRQPGTPLFWTRCSLGQEWDLTTCSCTGVASPMMWCEAMGEPTDTESCSATPATTNLCESTFGVDYRLPTGSDFAVLLGDCSDSDAGVPQPCDSCADSVDCTEMFGTDTGWYWSSTSFDNFSARYADFGGGGVGDTVKSTYGSVRCLRTGW
jgi:hypothetical protein